MYHLPTRGYERRATWRVVAAHSFPSRLREGSLLPGIPPGRKEIAEQTRGLLLPDARVYLGPMVHRWLREQAWAMFDRAALGVRRPII